MTAGSVSTRLLAILLLALAALAAGCAQRLQDVGSPSSPPQLTGEAIVTADGTRLPLQAWTASRPRAVVLALHGMNDYANAFAMPGPWFADRGISLFAYDQRGFGRTDQRGLWPGSRALVDDLATAVALLRSAHPDVPLYVMGVSMGGAVAMKAAAKGLAVDGLILVAPAIWGWQAMNPVYKVSLWLAAHTVPWHTATGSGLDIRPSDNIEMLRALGRDPHVIKETRIDAIYGLVSLMDEAYAAAGDIDVPVLYLYGARDEIIPAGPTQDTMQRLASSKRIVIYRDGWHMLLRDNQRARVWQDIAAWILDPAAPLPWGEEVDGGTTAPIAKHTPLSISRQN